MSHQWQCTTDKLFFILADTNKARYTQFYYRPILIKYHMTFFISADTDTDYTDTDNIIVMNAVGSCYEWWIRPNNYLSKLTSVFHECGKGSVSWWLNTTNVNIMMNINIGIKRWSSHETSHTSMSEICEFRVHSKHHWR